MSDATSYHTKLGDDGRIVIPAACRKHHGFQPGDTLVIDDTEDGLRLRSMSEVIKDIQAQFAPYRIPGVSVVDELIAERRAEAASEEEELHASLTPGKDD